MSIPTVIVQAAIELARELLSRWLEDSPSGESKDEGRKLIEIELAKLGAIMGTPQWKELFKKLDANTESHKRDTELSGKLRSFTEDGKTIVIDEEKLP